MAVPPRALPSHAKSRLDPSPDAVPLPDGVPFTSPLAPVDFDSTAALSADALRAAACEAPEPGARLAAMWRIMLRGQALPEGPPAEGIRLLTLLNLATQQDLDLLVGILELDPSSAVRAQAAILLWRVARDRDRVVGRLLARLLSDPSPDVRRQILTLSPPLPFARCLDRWAEGTGYAGMVQEGARYPEAAGAVLASLFRAGRTFRLAELSAFLDHAPIEAVLRVAGRPFDAADRRILVALTGLLLIDWPCGEERGRGAGPYRSVVRPRRGPPQPGRPTEELWSFLTEAYLGRETPALTDEEDAWAALLEARIAATDAEAAFWDGDDDRVERLLRLLRHSRRTRS